MPPLKPADRLLSATEIAGILVFMAAFCLFYAFFQRDVGTDLQLHIRQLVRINAGEAPLPPNFLLYGLLALVSGGSTNINVLSPLLALTLAGCLTAKFIISRRILAGLLLAESAPALRPGILTALALAMLFVFPLPRVDFFTENKYYPLQIVPTVWHNSTIIALMPFALLLYWEQYRAVALTNRPREWVLLSLVLLNLAIKPSFFFVYALATPLLVLRHCGISWRAVRHLIPVGIGGIGLLVQTVLIYRFNYGSFQAEKSEVVWAPLDVWNWNPHLSPYILLICFSLPLLYVILLGEWRQERVLFYPALLSVFALLIYGLLAEAGPRRLDYNFSWQNIPAMYILLLVTLARFTQRLLTSPAGRP